MHAQAASGQSGGVDGGSGGGDGGGGLAIATPMLGQQVPVHALDVLPPVAAPAVGPLGAAAPGEEVVEPVGALLGGGGALKVSIVFCISYL